MNLAKKLVLGLALLAIVIVLSQVTAKNKENDFVEDVIVKQKPPHELLIFIHYPKGKAVGLATKGGKVAGDGACPFKLTGKWATNSLSFAVNSNDSGLDQTSVINAITSSFAAWSDASGLLPPSVGTTAILPSTYSNESMNGINEIGFASLGAKGFTDAIAVTYVWRDIGTKKIVEADMVNNIDPGFAWFIAPLQDGNPNNWTLTNTGKFDLQNIDTHEFGHFVGLDHVRSNTEQTMYPFSTPDEVKKRSLECGDLAGVQKLYGPQE